MVSKKHEVELLDEAKGAPSVVGVCLTFPQCSDDIPAVLIVDLLKEPAIIPGAEFMPVARLLAAPPGNRDWEKILPVQLLVRLLDSTHLTEALMKDKLALALVTTVVFSALNSAVPSLAESHAENAADDAAAARHHIIEIMIDYSDR